jgi:hypothetical protein
MKNIAIFILYFFVFILISPILLGEKCDHQKQHLSKPLIQSSAIFDVNRIDCDIMNNGMFVSHIQSGRSGLQWPKGNGTGTIYASGVWYGGIVNGDVRVSAAEFTGEFASGSWNSDHADPIHQIYKVSKNDLTDPIRSTDFQNWPISLGAPWIDNDKNGKYEPLPNGPDHPDFIGDQVLWMVMNDGIDSLHTIFHTEPLGIEVQRTIFGFNRSDPIGDMMFVRDILINKGDNTIQDMYVGLWSDPDLGDASDDYVGCDTTLGMGISYNDGEDAAFNDPSWEGITPINMTPAVGYDLLQGPFISSLGDTAYAFGNYIPDYKNLSMSSFMGYT